MTNIISLPQLGWHQFFQQQLTLDELYEAKAARIMAHHRNGFQLQMETGSYFLPVTSRLPEITVGDWLLLNQKNQFIRLLERFSVFTRKAAGSHITEQLIASNIDTVFLVCSLNDDFNLSRIERYLTLVKNAGAEAVVVLTKVDCCDKPDNFIQQVRQLDSRLVIEAVNALEPMSVKVLTPWCDKGKTVALLGSSGVGKSTLINSLLGTPLQQTGEIRLDDSKGKHTTTGRSLHLMPLGGLLMDTPGMRELQLVDCEQGVKATFSDINDLAEQCRFADCQHESEPECAIKEALKTGLLDKRRLSNYLKLQKEVMHNNATFAEKRARDKSLSKLYRSVVKNAKRNKS